MSEQSFALLATLNSQNAGGSANPLVGPMATFASDTETLKQALGGSDARAQATAVNSLASDCVVIDNALKTNPKALNLDDWKTIRGELDQIAREVARSTAGKIANAPAVAESTNPPSAPPAPPIAPAASPTNVTPPPLASAPPMTPPNPPAVGPVVKIESRTVTGDVVRIKGYIEGSGLKSAGIYQDGQPLKTFDVGNVLGEKKIDLDLGIGSPPLDAVIRVTDANGRSAEAPVVAPGASAHGGALTSNETTEGGVGVLRDSPSRDSGSSGGDSGGAVEEIPSHSTTSPSPSHRHTLGGHLANVQINVLGLTETTTTPPTFEITGQIDGPGVTHAGIYVDGRLIKPLPVETGGDFMNFDERVVLNGDQATIRAYGAGNHFVENSVDLTNSVASAQPMGPTPPLPPNAMAYAYAPHPSAPGIGVLITSVHPAGGNLYAVGGTISGTNIASAGLYQNGVLAQPIQIGGALGGTISGGGLGSLLGSILPGSSKSVNFNVRVNPGAGSASIRAYNQMGQYTEQPIMTVGMNPNGVVNPYGTAANPNGAFNPYGATNPYGGATSPYTMGRPSGGISVPIW
jgi:hypothetical protein